MKFFVDNWDPSFGVSSQFDPNAESTARRELGVERPVADWGAIPLPEGVVSPETILFIDGVRRTDVNITVVDPDEVEPDQIGLCASYAAGVVVCNSQQATVSAVNIRRGLFTASPSAADICSGHGNYRAHVVPMERDQPAVDVLSLALQNQMLIIEVDSACQARDSLPADAVGDDLLVIDGPLRGRDHLERAIGLIKTHHSHYLDPDLHRMVGTLQSAERTPVFLIGTTWDRFTWYLRLPTTPGAPWKGVVRIECSSSLSRADAIALANLSQVVLPRYASREHRDPRAPQNLYPIGGLERELRHRLGDRDLLVRSLRRAAA